jgi:hypothetical protein
MHLMAFEDGQRGGSLLVDAADTDYVLDIASDNLSWQVVAERRK